jgi:hypothetical protein
MINKKNDIKSKINKTYDDLIINDEIIKLVYGK